MNAAQKAWETRRARATAREQITSTRIGTSTPSPAYDPAKPVVDLWLDHDRVGCGQRRYVVLEVGTKWVRLFYPPLLMLVKIDRFTFDRFARPALDAKPAVIKKIIRANVAQARRLNDGLTRPVVSDGGNRTKQALEALDGR